MKKFLTACLIFHLSSFISAVHADFSKDDAGTSALQFLKLGAGARAEGLGGAYGAVPEDATALYWNPAGLASLDSKSASFMHAVYAESIFYDFLSCAIPVGKTGGAGASVQYLSMAGIDETNDEGLVTGSFRPEHFTMTLGGAYRLSRLSIGGSLKYVRARIKESATTATADFGLLYQAQSFAFGLSAQNIFSSITFDRDPNRLPLNYKLSSACRPTKKLLFALDLNLPNDNQPDVSAGMERSLGLTEGWSLVPRIGYSSRANNLSGLNGVTAGFGLMSRRTSVDYAWAPMGDLGQTHRISITVKWDLRKE